MATAGAFDRVVAASLPLVPGPVVRRLAAPYVAGLMLDDALRTVRELQADGLTATVDVLGEAVLRPAAVESAVAAYVETLDALAAAALPSGVSVKPTALGGLVDWDLCRDAVRAIATHAAGHHRFVRIDMEDAGCIQPTLRLYRGLRDEGPQNIGIVLQARLWQTPDDLQSVADLQPDVRLCKGVYLEPPRLAAQDDDAVRRQFSALLRKLLRLGCRIGIATHDEALIVDALAALDELGAERERHEFQMLLGVRHDLALVLARAGYRVRVYVPYGSDVYAYSVRRLRENPNIAGAVARNLLADPAGAVASLAGRRRSVSSRHRF